MKPIYINNVCFFPEGRISEEQLIDFERESNFHFPKSYRDFLLKTNGGVPEMKCFVRVVDKHFSQELFLERFNSLDEIKQGYHYLHDNDLFIDSTPRLMPIGDTIGSQTICVSLEGHIYVWDCDFGATYQADSLADFLSQLRVYDEVLV